MGGGESQPGGGCGGIGGSVRSEGGGRENRGRDAGAGGGLFGGPREVGGGAKGLLSGCPISISRDLPHPSPPLPPHPSLLTESMSFIPERKITMILFGIWENGEQSPAKSEPVRTSNDPK